VRWIRDRSLGLLFAVLFLATWAAQLVVQWFEFVDDQQAHDQPAAFWSSDFWVTFWQATLENWQSEFLQLGSFVIAAGYLVYKGSSERSARRATSGRPPRAPARPGSRSHGGHVGIR
jgi:hypothetical protein